MQTFPVFLFERKGERSLTRGNGSDMEKFLFMDIMNSIRA